MTTDLEAMKHILATLEANPSTNTREDMILRLLRHLMWHLEYQQNLIKLLLKDEPKVKAV